MYPYTCTCTHIHVRVFVPSQMLLEKCAVVSVKVSIVPRDWSDLNSYKLKSIQEMVAAIED